MLHHAAPCCTMLQRAAPCCTMLHHAAPCCTMLHHAAPCCTMLHHAAPCCTVLHRAAPCCTVLHHAAPCCNVMHHAAPTPPPAPLDAGSVIRPRGAGSSLAPGPVLPSVRPRRTGARAALLSQDAARRSRDAGPPKTASASRCGAPHEGDVALSRYGAVITRAVTRINVRCGVRAAEAACRRGRGRR